MRDIRPETRRGEGDGALSACTFRHADENAETTDLNVSGQFPDEVD